MAASMRLHAAMVGKHRIRLLTKSLIHHENMTHVTMFSSLRMNPNVCSPYVLPNFQSIKAFHLCSRCLCDHREYIGSHEPRDELSQRKEPRANVNRRQSREFKRERMSKLHNLTSYQSDENGRILTYYDDSEYDYIGTLKNKYKYKAEQIDIKRDEYANPKDEDFFGIHEAEENEGLSHQNDNFSNKEGLHPMKKFRTLIRNDKKIKQMERIIAMPYGTMRRDVDNQPGKHGYLREQNSETSPEELSKDFADRLFKTEHSDPGHNRFRHKTKGTDEGEGYSLNPGHQTASNVKDQFKSVNPHIKDLANDKFDFMFDNENSTLKSSKTEIESTNLSSARKKQDKIPSKKEGEINVFDDQYFSEIISDTSPVKKDEIVKCNSEIKQNVFDEQYFTEAVYDTDQTNLVSSSVAQSKTDKNSPIENNHIFLETNIKGKDEINQNTNSTNINVFEQQYFDEKNETFPNNIFSHADMFSNKINEVEYKSESFQNNSYDNQRKITKSHLRENKEESSTAQGSINKYNSGKTFDNLHKSETNIEDESHLIEDIHVGSTTDFSKISHKFVESDTKTPVTAYDLALKVRREKKQNVKIGTAKAKEISTPNDAKWTGALDSHGFRKLKDQVLDVNNMPADIVTGILKESILHETDEFVAINKPYGLPSHGGPGVHHSVGKLLPLLTEKLGLSDDLRLVHRLDKETTGVMLLAKTSNEAFKLRSYFKERRALKRYWVITKGIPNPYEGEIDIPIIESGVNGRYRMKLLPYKSDETSTVIRKQHRDVPRKDAVTQYKVLDSANGAALIECHPLTGVKHQIRCHLAFGLNTPILGDHKYSHYSRIIPQKLPTDMLKRLGVRQQTVRYIPMHLHAKELVLPQFYKGRNMFINCRLPKHFVQNMKWLQLKPPKGKH